MFSKNLLVALVAVVFVGCTERAPMQIDTWREVAAPPRAQEAVDVAVATMGIKGTPEIHWYGGAGLDADCGGVAWHPADAPEICVGGEERDGVLAIAYPDGVSVASTQFIHELGHMLAEELYG